MLIIKHRCNNSEDLKKIPIELGCEIDIRNHGKKLIVVHDPFQQDGEDLVNWLQNFRHQFLILNVKEEGLEEELLRLLKNKDLSNFFILDESFPFIRKWALKGVENFAVRVSEYESYKTALALASDLQKKNLKIGWIWADCFEGNLLPTDEINALKDAGYKICYVSPELHHLDNPSCWPLMIEGYMEKMKIQNITPDAVCTKICSLWKKF